MKLEYKIDNVSSNRPLVKNEKGEILCGCGSDEYTVTTHVDGTKFYLTGFRCEKCGAVIEVINDRSNDDLLYYCGEEE